MIIYFPKIPFLFWEATNKTYPNREYWLNWSLIVTETGNGAEFAAYFP